MKRADLIAPAIQLRRAGLRARRRATPRCSRPRPRTSRSIRRPRRSSSSRRPALRRRRPAGAEGPRGDAAPDQRRPAPPASTRARSARAIVASSQAGKGIITQADLDQYTTRELAPVECDYRGYHIVSAPPPSSGGVIICEILNILEGYPLKELGFRSAQAVHVPDRGDAPRLRRPQQLPRRSRLRQEPARPPARQGLRREDPRRHRPGEGRRSRRT